MRSAILGLRWYGPGPRLRIEKGGRPAPLNHGGRGRRVEWRPNHGGSHNSNLSTLNVQCCLEPCQNLRSLLNCISFECYKQFQCWISKPIENNIAATITISTWWIETKFMLKWTKHESTTIPCAPHTEKWIQTTPGHIITLNRQSVNVRSCDATLTGIATILYCMWFNKKRKQISYTQHNSCIGAECVNCD